MSQLDTIRESLRAIRARISQIGELRNQAKALRAESFELYEKICKFSNDLRDMHLLCEGACLALDHIQEERKGASNV